MEEKKNPLEQVSNYAETNVKNVSISDYTKALLLCKAKMSDAFNSVANIYQDEFNEDLPKEFVDGWFMADAALNKMIGQGVDYIFSNNDYNQI